MLVWDRRPANQRAPAEKIVRQQCLATKIVVNFVPIRIPEKPGLKGKNRVLKAKLMHRKPVTLQHFHPGVVLVAFGYGHAIQSRLEYGHVGCVLNKNQLNTFRDFDRRALFRS